MSSDPHRPCVVSLIFSLSGSQSGMGSRTRIIWVILCQINLYIHHPNRKRLSQLKWGGEGQHWGCFWFVLCVRWPSNKPPDFMQHIWWHVRSSDEALEPIMQAAMSAKTRTKTKSIVTGCNLESPQCTNITFWLLFSNFWLTVPVNPSVWTQGMNFVLKSQEQSTSSLHDLGKFPMQESIGEYRLCIWL